MQETVKSTFTKIYGMKENPFMILLQNDELARSIYYSKNGDEIELLIDRNIALPKSLVIKRKTGEIVEYKGIENEIQLRKEDRELIEQVMDRVIEENDKYGVEYKTGNDLNMFFLQYLLIESGYKNIVFEEINMRLELQEKNEEYKKLSNELTSNSLEYPPRFLKIINEEFENAKNKIEKIIQNRPKNSIIIMPYGNFILPTMKKWPHAIAIIIQTDSNKQFNQVNIINSDGDNFMGGPSCIHILGLGKIFPNKEYIAISNSTFQNDKSCYLMTSQVIPFIQKNLNSGRSLDKITKNFNKNDKFEFIDTMRQNPTIMALKPFTNKFNNPDYYLYTTKGIERKINELKENNQFTKENIKKLLDDIIIFSSENKIDLDKLTKRLIKCRNFLKTALHGTQKLFDEAIKAKQSKEQRGEQNDGFTIKFKQKNYSHEDTKHELTSFISRISGIVSSEQHL